MAKQTVVRYTTKDSSASADNQRLIEAVFAELAAEQPEGVRHYTVSRLDDGVSFVHVAVIDGDANPLVNLKSFQAFSSTVSDRTIEPPVAVTGDVIAYHS
jgi:hypothetical protein